ncbi:hypothetical protein D3C81_1015740 [compost metagenome]
MIVNLLHLGDVLVHAHVGEVRELSGVGLTERHILVEHAIEGEQYVVGVEFAGWLEEVGGMKLDPFTQVEGIGQAVIGNVPAGRQAGDDRSAATLKLAEAIEDCLG